MKLLSRRDLQEIRALAPAAQAVWSDIIRWIVSRQHEPSDRAVAILAASFLESSLEHVLDATFINHRTTRDLFARQGVLSTLSAKTDLAFALGLIAEWEWKDMERIRRIRNHFAHRLEAASFDEQPVSQLCDQLFMARFSRARGLKMKARRDSFVQTSGLLGALLSLSARRRRPRRCRREHLIAFAERHPAALRAKRSRRRRRR